MFRRIASRLLGGHSAGSGTQTDPSRREVLAGLFAVGAVAAVGSAFAHQSEARAATPTVGPMSLPEEGNLELVQRRRDDDDEIPGTSGRSFRRRDRDRDRGRRRTSRRDIRARCRSSRSFRRENRRLCERAFDRGRRGACVQIGPILLCD